MMLPTLSGQSLLRTRQACLDADQQWIDNIKAKEEVRQIERETLEQSRAAERERSERERETLVKDIRDALASEAISNFVADVLFRTAKRAGISEAELTGPLAVASAPATAEPLTDEWGEVIGR